MTLARSLRRGGALMHSRAAMLAVLLAIEIAGLSFAYQFLTAFDCDLSGAEGACRFMRSLVARAVSVLAAFALYGWARPGGLGFLLRRSEARPPARKWLSLHLAGAALMFAPLLLGRDGELAELFSAALVAWILGAGAATAGALLWLGQAGDWLAWLRGQRFAPLAVLAAAFLIPDIANLALPLWDWTALTRLTFDAVWLVLDLVGETPEVDLTAYLIGIDGFAVRIARQCSGVEGFALVTGFTLLHGFLFHEDTRFPHFWLVVLPLGLALSWGLNVVRIAALVWIGAYISPELAANGFHSFAGWMFFTALALSLLVLARAIPWLRSVGDRSPAAPIREDWNAALILPFLAFMLASVVGSALLTRPELADALRALAIAAALGVFADQYRRLEWSLDPVALGAGALVGLAWLVTQPAGGPDTAALAAVLAELGGVAFAVWFVLRLAGGVLLVPLAEELFFRGYVLARLDRGGLVGRFVAVAVSSALFAVLHQRWTAALLAGVVFALVMLRRSRLTDAIAAHMVANLVLAAYALARGDWAAL